MMHPFLSPSNWILPILITAGFSVLLWKQAHRIPKKAGEAIAWAGGGLSSLFWFAIFGSIGTGNATFPLWIASVALVAQLFSVVSDYELKSTLYPKIAGAIAAGGQFYTFFTLAGITVAGLVGPPVLGQIIPLTEAFSLSKLVLPILFTVIIVLVLKAVVTPKPIGTTAALVSPFIWVVYWLLSDYGATTGSVVVPIQFAVLPIFASMVGTLANYVGEKEWALKIGASICLATTAFFSMFFAGVHL